MNTTTNPAPGANLRREPTNRADHADAPTESPQGVTPPAPAFVTAYRKHTSIFYDAMQRSLRGGR
jgi:hypothetical protein